MYAWLLLVLILPLTLCSLTFYVFFRDQGTFDTIGVYTLTSALLILILPLINILIALYYEKKQGYYYCCNNMHDWHNLYITFIWLLFTFGVLFSSGHLIPSVSSYGGFTILYMIISTLIIPAIFIIFLNLLSR